MIVKEISGCRTIGLQWFRVLYAFIQTFLDAAKRFGIDMSQSGTGIFPEIEMFQVCQIESNISASRAVFIFKAAQVSRGLIFDFPDRWSSAYGEQVSIWGSKDCIAFLFLLERPFDDLVKLFKNAEEVIGDGLLAASFPTNGIVLKALNDHGEYWMDLALKWMDHPQFQFGSELLERIKTLAFRKTRNQKLLHRFMKLYARLKRDGLLAGEQS